MANNSLSTLARKTNDELLSDLRRLARTEREATAAVVAHLGEIDARRIFLDEGFNSLFVYCVETLGFSEEAAYNRIKAARAARRFPVILEMLGDGSVNLTTARLLAPHLTEQNHGSVLESAKGKTRREVEVIVARLAPQPDVPTSIRKLPEPKRGQGLDAVPLPLAAPCVDAPTAPVSSAVAARPAPPQPPSQIAALSPDRFKLQLTVSGQTIEKLRLAQDMLRHALPSGDEAEIIDRALAVFLEDLTRRKFADTDRPRGAREPRPGSRYIPASIRRAVWLRDMGRCAYVSPAGKRCGARGYLEFHHLVPFAAGGETTVENLRLECRLHNAREAELYFGPRDGTIVREVLASYGFATATTGPGTSWATLGRPT